MAEGSIHTLTGRAARNIYFWVIFLAIQMFSFLREDYSAALILQFVYSNLVVTAMMAVIVYVNNLFLLPRYFDKKEYLIYFIGITAWVVLSSAVLQKLYNFMFSSFPELYTNENGMLVQIDFWEVIFINVLFVFGFTMAKFANDFFNSEERLRKIESKQIESELNFLRSQINPHFLFNTLNTIYALSLKKSDETPEVVLKLSDLLRYMLYECKSEKIELEKEINVLRSYIELEKIRLKNTDAVSVEIEGDPQNRFIAPLLWIPFVENAFKHGLNTRANDGYVKIRIHIRSREIVFYCENNFSPVPADSKTGGIGVDNTRKRLALIYPGKHKLELLSKDQIFTVNLILQYPTT
ncbi:MAG: sensor histidine kinase [Flavobacteriales bacterium]